MVSQTATVNPWWMGASQAQEAWEGYFRRLAKMPRIMELAKQVRNGATPHEVVYRENQLRLLRYESDVPKAHATPLLIVFALVNRPYILDLRPEKSVVRQFLNRGFDVYLIDWGVPTAADRTLGIQDYVDRYMVNVVHEILEITGSDQLSLLGYCMGGSLSAMFTALHQDLIRNFILMAAPVDWSDKESLLSVWTDEKYFDVDKMLEVHGNAPAEWMQSSFTMLKPVQNLIQKHITFYENMEDEKFVEDFLAMEAWLNDNIPMAGETFRQFVKYCFRQNLLIQGRLKIGRRTVDLHNITCPILNLMASNDHLVPCGLSAPFNDAVGSSDRRAITLPSGHIGLAVGSRAHRELWPEACDWLAERSVGC